MPTPSLTNSLFFSTKVYKKTWTSTDKTTWEIRQLGWTKTRTHTKAMFYNWKRASQKDRWRWKLPATNGAIAISSSARRRSKLRCTIRTVSCPGPTIRLFLTRVGWTIWTPTGKTYSTFKVTLVFSFFLEQLIDRIASVIYIFQFKISALKWALPKEKMVHQCRFCQEKRRGRPAGW